MAALSPPLHLLRALVAVSQTGSITAAAERLSLTQSAVSKRMLELEALLGVPLLQRHRQRVSLLPPALRYVAQITPALAAIDAASLDVALAAHADGRLRIASLATFDAKWLIPRLPSFFAAYPRIELEFLPRDADTDASVFDVAFRYGHGHWEGCECHEVGGRAGVVIAPPDDRLKLRRPQQLAQLPLLHHSDWPDAWPQWAKAHGLSQPTRFARGMALDQIQTLIRAVSASLGVALVPDCLVQDELAQGLVLKPFAENWMSPNAYHLCVPTPKADLPEVRAFSDWVRTQASTPKPPTTH